MTSGAVAFHALEQRNVGRASLWDAPPARHLAPHQLRADLSIRTRPASSRPTVRQPISSANCSTVIPGRCSTRRSLKLAGSERARVETISPPSHEEDPRLVQGRWRGRAAGVSVERV